MPRAIWSGSISFGLVNIPIKLYAAVSRKTVHFNQFEEGTPDRIRYKRINERTGLEVDVRRQGVGPAWLDMVVGPLHADTPQFAQCRLQLLFQGKSGLRADRLAAKLLQQLPQAL